MALAWVDEMVGLMADCWAERMNVMRVGGGLAEVWLDICKEG